MASSLDVFAWLDAACDWADEQFPTLVDAPYDPPGVEMGAWLQGAPHGDDIQTEMVRLWRADYAAGLAPQHPTMPMAEMLAKADALLASRE